MSTSSRLRRLFTPRHIAYVGGNAAAAAIRQCQALGFDGAIWPVHPRRASLAGIACYPSVEALPEAPDAAFVAVPVEATIDVVAALSGRGGGGAVCHASGFAEAHPHGRRLQARLVRAAADMPLIGPNCLGMVSYLDRVALWPEQHGGRPVDRGVAIVTQSGNIGQNLTMHRRALPIGRLITVGNGAGVGIPEIVDALLADDRVSTIGLHLEGIDDPAALARSALTALRRRVPIVVLKTGTSELGARANLGHTSSLAGSDTLADALFDRVGMARVRDVEAFLETLKLLHVHGSLAGSSIASASCSGGEAALVADAAHRLGLRLPAFPERTRAGLRHALGDRVGIGNPLDYHTYVWGDADRLTGCFEAFLRTGFDAQVLVVDLPRDDRCDDADWHTTVDAFVTAHRRTATPACVVSLLPEGMPEHLGQRLLTEGIAPMQGLDSCLAAIERAVWIGRAQRRVDEISGFPARGPMPVAGQPVAEHVGKRLLAEQGIRVPGGGLAHADQTGDVARSIGFPVVAKLATGLAHKSEVDGVRLGLADESQLADAVAAMRSRGDTFLIEEMVDDAVAELIVGVRRDPTYGLALTVGSGGVLVELISDTATLLLPASRSAIAAALRTLRGWPLLTGYRGRKPADVDAVVDSVDVIARYAYECRDRLLELEVNPLLVLPEGCGVVAADVVMRCGDNADPRKEKARGRARTC